jgi:hypothetical protein
MDRNLKVHWDDVMGKALTIRLLTHCTAIIRMPGCCLFLMQGITCHPVTAMLAGDGPASPSHAGGTRRHTCQTNKLAIPVQLISLSRLAVICEVKLDTQALVALMTLHEAQRMQLHPATTSQ